MSATEELIAFIKTAIAKARKEIEAERAQERSLGRRRVKK